jgi:hypothetical protein
VAPETRQAVGDRKEKASLSLSRSRFFSLSSSFFPSLSLALSISFCPEGGGAHAREEHDDSLPFRCLRVSRRSLCLSTEVLSTETNVESGKSQSKISAHLRNRGELIRFKRPYRV